MYFHEVYEYFRNFFLFLSYIDYSFENFFKLISMKFMSIFERFFFFCHIDFIFQKNFFYEFP